MIIHNLLPHLLDCLTRWTKCPSAAQFEIEYAGPLREITGGFFDNLYEDLPDLNWYQYRNHALKLNPLFEEARFLKNLEWVESLFQFKLEGEVFLIGAFYSMDGFARFNKGTHRVFLGVDEAHLKGRYLDILTTHELTHVARETRPEVWQGFGLDPKMSRSDFLEYQPVIEHIFGEGFSCVVSEILIPNEAPWTYTYQSESSLQQIKIQASELDQIIKKEILSPDGDYGSLYGISPLFSQYVWGSEWVKSLLRDHANGDPRKLVSRCSKDFLESAISFKLNSARAF